MIEFVLGAIVIVFVSLYIALRSDEEKTQNTGDSESGPQPNPVNPPERPVDEPREDPGIPDKPVGPETPGHRRPRPVRDSLEDVSERAVRAIERKGIETVEELESVEDLTEIDGIGNAYAEEIRKKLED